MTLNITVLTRPMTSIASLCFAVMILTPAVAETPDQVLIQKAVTPEQALRYDEKTKTHWFDGTVFTVEGKGFDDTATTWSRLPARYKGKVTEGVWSTGQSPAGVSLRFITDSPAVFAEWDAPRSSMNHMARSGSNGLDLYAKVNGKWTFAGAGIPQTTGTSNSRLLPRQFSNAQTDHQPVAPTEYMLFLPTYSELKRIEIGVTSGSKIAAAQISDKKPVVFYGTSISQAGCASRAGLGHIERLRRALDHPTVNLGFSGSGKCEPIMAELLAESPASLYVIETIPNMSDELVNERTLPFLKKLRELQADTPILMVASPNVWLNADRNALWKKIFQQAVDSGLTQLYFLDGDDLYGPTDNPTVDGVHPTDLGFYYMAIGYEATLRQLLDIKSDAGSNAKNL